MIATTRPSRLALLWRRALTVLAVCVAFGLVVPAEATARSRGKVVAKSKAKAKPTAKAKAKPKGKGKAKVASRRTDKGTSKVCKTVETGKGKRKKKKRSCKRVKTFQGHGVARATLRTEPLTQPSGELEVWSDNLGEGAKVNIYKRDASGALTTEFDDEALAQLDEVFRCRRTNETRAVDPKLYEQLSRVLDYFRAQEDGEDRRLEIVSGLRYNERNSSRHHHASAADIRIKGVGIREMYAYAESLDGGGMGIGIYPTSGFIHMDFRAPGEPSYRWTDLSGPGEGNGRKGKKPKAKAKSKPRTQPARRPTS